MDIQQAKVIITGATSGIGLETARLLKEKGAQVIICGRNETKLEKAMRELDVLGFPADVSNELEVQALFEMVIKEWGDFNVVINNAGMGKFAPLVETTVDEFQQQWEINTKGLFLVGREAAKHFIKKQSGNIVNIGSTAAVRGFAQGSGYVASKFAVSGLTDCWRAELRPHNIRVMQVNPSEVVTDFLEKAGVETKDSDYKLKPTHIAHAILSMLSMDDIGFIPSAEVWATNPNRK